MVATVKVTLASVGGTNSAPRAESFNCMEMKDAVSTSLACDTGSVVTPAAPNKSAASSVAYIRVSDGDVWANSAADTGVQAGPTHSGSVRLFSDDKVFMSIGPGHYVAFRDDTG